APGRTCLRAWLAAQWRGTPPPEHGAGSQIPVVSAAYTKLVIAGPPWSGRTAGTFNLDRITVGNVQQVEMIKGPSSALWGSDALAGVINIITEKGQRPFELGISSRYGTNKTLDTGLNLSARTNRWEHNLFVKIGRAHV